MTKHITQRNYNDCMLACIAMAAGKDYDELWSPELVQEIVESRGVSNDRANKLLEHAGFHPYVNGDEGKIVWRHNLSAGVPLCDGLLRNMLQGRRAILSVPSLNHLGGWHAVYWDGGELFDPNKGFDGKQHYQWLEHLTVRTIWIFDERTPA